MSTLNLSEVEDSPLSDDTLKQFLSIDREKVSDSTLDLLLRWRLKEDPDFIGLHSVVNVRLHLNDAVVIDGKRCVLVS